jgi:4-amino-4-deoxy-L-arabinose transferase-like glycosyltransferase
MLVMLSYVFGMLRTRFSWYLGIDQFGYVTFARDLLAGRLFHDWPPLAALGDLVPRPTDLLGQTYVWDGVRAYCRYPPGYPAMLAAATAVLGPDAFALVNPLVFVALIAVLIALAWRLLGSPWRAGIAGALFVLCPSASHLWALTITRDPAVHLFALTGLLLLLPRHAGGVTAWRMAAAGLCLGFSMCIRPDAVLYLPAAAAMAAVHWTRRRVPVRGPAAAIVLAGLVVGAVPLFTYNQLAVGDPLRMTQGMEVAGLLGEMAPREVRPPIPRPAQPRLGFPPRAWQGGTHEQVQGSGLRTSNLETTFPRLLGALHRAYGPALLGLAVWGLLVAGTLRPTLAVGVLAYVPLALVFYGLWPRADPRYLMGVFAFLPMLIVEGTFGAADVARWLRRRGRGERAGIVPTLVGIASVAALLLQGRPDDPSLAVVARAVPLAAALVAAAAATGFHVRRVSAATAVVLMLGLVVTSMSHAGRIGARPAAFQQAQMAASRASMARLLPPGAVLITTEDVGRVVENVEYHVPGVHALYLTDLKRWRLPLPAAATALLAAGRRPYLFIPPTQPNHDDILRNLRNRGFVVERVAQIAAQDGLRHFVATPFHQGVDMELFRLGRPVVEDRLVDDRPDAAAPR